MTRPLTLRRSNAPDLYCIEWAEHAHEYLLTSHPDGMQADYSGRVCDADVEGTSAEMASIAKALETGEPARHERCAVVRAGLGWDIWSPRNSEKPGRITKKQAAHLAVEIRRVLDAE